jgi:hypothetical protein
MHTGCPVIKGVKWTGALKGPGNRHDGGMIMRALLQSASCWLHPDEQSLADAICLMCMQAQCGFTQHRSDLRR